VDIARSNAPFVLVSTATVAFTTGGGGGFVVPMLPPPHAVRAPSRRVLTPNARTFMATIVMNLRWPEKMLKVVEDTLSVRQPKE
jgi:hypothetical protein